jgi:hypothetical protein
MNTSRKRIYKEQRVTGILGRSWNELRTRLRQETAKRWDAIRYHIGVPLHEIKGSAGPQEKCHFIFEPEDVPALISLLRIRMPEQVVESVKRAERICRHHFDLLGYEQLDLGAEIDWHRDVVHNRRAPLKPWFKIRYLDFEEVGDSKIIWELSRHQQLTTLAKAYLFTEDHCCPN